MRLRARGVRLASVRKTDLLLVNLKFAKDKYLTPGEQDVLRRFCSRFCDLPRLPTRLAVFGSRARGDSDENSDLDVGVYFQDPRDRETESRLSSIAYDATRSYRSGNYGIRLRPVPLFGKADAAFAAAIEPEAQTLWTAPQ